DASGAADDRLRTAAERSLEPGSDGVCGRLCGPASVDGRQPLGCRAGRHGAWWRGWQTGRLKRSCEHQALWASIDGRPMVVYGETMDYRTLITIEPDKRSGQPCI